MYTANRYIVKIFYSEKHAPSLYILSFWNDSLAKCQFIAMQKRISPARCRKFLFNLSAKYDYRHLSVERWKICSIHAWLKFEWFFNSGENSGSSLNEFSILVKSFWVFIEEGNMLYTCIITRLYFEWAFNSGKNVLRVYWRWKICFIQA